MDWGFLIKVIPVSIILESGVDLSPVTHIYQNVYADRVNILYVLYL